MITNPYSAEERLQAMVTACYRASRAHFSHLPIRQIIDPPNDLLDAKLARQVAIAVLARDLDIPVRRLAKVLGVGRWMVAQSIRTIEYRRQEPVFDRAYERIAARALVIFEQVMREAADYDAEEAA